MKRNEEQYPQRIVDLTPDDAASRMKWCDREDIYVLNAGIEKRMSTLSQQYRAISLIGALIEQKKIVPSQRIAIIGAGIAGVTAAAVALTRGCRCVEMYEKMDRVAATFEKSSRLIDPRLYEWPVADWKVKQAKLSLLNWEASPGKEITNTIRSQLGGWMRVFGPDAANARIKWNLSSTVRPSDIVDTAGFLYDSRILKIVAVGFGRPQELANLQGAPGDMLDYWQSPEKASSEGMRIGVVGAQDGGLTEAIEHSLWSVNDVQAISQLDLRAFLECFAEVLGHQQTQSLAKTLLKLDERAVKWSESDPTLVFEELKKQGAEGFDKALKCVGFRPRNSPPVLVFVRTTNKDDPPVIKPNAFLLNRWFAAHLIRLKAMRVVACRNNFARDIVRDKEVYTIPTWNGNEEVDRLFVRMGPQPAEGWEDFLTEFRKAAVQRTSAVGSTWNPDVMYPIARRPPPVAFSGSRCFYSDLFDSTTQRAVLDALIAEGGTLKNAEDELVRLYSRRFLVEAARRDVVLLSDNQVFDGAFFLRWLPKLSEVQLQSLACHVRIGSRAQSPQAVLNAFVSNGTYAKSFEFSAIIDQQHREAITSVLSPNTTLNDIHGVRDLLANNCEIEGVRKAWDMLTVLHNSLVATLNTRVGAALIHVINFAQTPMDHVSALEDPGAFEQSNLGAAELVDYAFKPDLAGKAKSRTAVYEHLNKKHERIENVVDPTRDWYDRGYARAIGFQQAQAAMENASLVFETVHTQGLLELHPRDGDDSNVVTQPHEELDSEDIDFMMGLRAKCSEWRLAGGTRLFHWSTGKPIAANAEQLDLGKRALALLRGSTGLMRVWTEEASQVGPRVPAVSDEEHLGEWSEKNRLNRVEYFADISR